MLNTIVKVSVLVLVMMQFACDSRHSGVYSYEEAYVANKANDFEFAHFKFFGSDNVIILNESTTNKKDYSALCKIHAMDCHEVTVDVTAKDVKVQMQKALSHIDKYQGGSFMVVSTNPNSTAALLGKFAQKKYKASSKKITEIISNLKADKPQDVESVLGL